MSAERPTRKPTARPERGARATATTAAEAEVGGIDKIEAARARLGRKIGGYELQEVLGVGGSACVYRGVKRGREAAAIKVLHAWLGADPRAKKRFLREATVAERIAHPAVVRTLDHGEEADGTAYLVMELSEGETIEARRIAAGGRLPADEVIRLMDELLAVLAVTHAGGVVHRDIKPTNLIRASDGSLRLLDFGIACVTDLSEASSLVTRTGAVLGTVFFMAPEQALGVRDDIDARSDVWAVGATMFTLLTGQFVHQARTANEGLVLAATQPAPPIRSVRPEVSAPIAGVVDRALSFDRAARYADAGAMREALLRAARGEVDAAAPAMIDTMPETTTRREHGGTSGPSGKSALTYESAASRRVRAWPLVAGAAVVVAMMSFLLGRGSPRAGAGGTAVGTTATQEAARPVEAKSSEPPPPAPSDTGAATPDPAPAPPRGSAKTLPPPKPSAAASARATARPAPAPPAASEPEPFF